MGLILPAYAAEPLTPATAVEMALRQTPELVQSRAQVAEARGAVREAKGHLLPKLSLGLTASSSDNPLNVFGMKVQQRQATFNDFGAGQFVAGMGDPTIVDQRSHNLDNPGWYQNYQTRFQVQVPIYNGGQIWGGVHRAEAMLEAARHGEVFARQKILFEVIRLFEGIRTAEGYGDAAAKGVKAATAYVDLTQKLYAQGVVDKTDVLRARVHLGDARLAAAEAEKQRAVAAEGLRVLTGLADSAPLNLAPGHLRLHLVEADLPKLQQQAVGGNPGLRALGSQLQAAQAGVSQARAAYLPHLNLMLAHEWNDDSVGLAHPSDTVAGVLNWDIFDFGARGGAVDRAEAKVIQRRGALRSAQNELRVKVQGAWQEVHLAAIRIELKQAGLADAREAARLATLRYEKGVATFTQLLAAQAELDKARAELVSAHYQQVMAQAGLLLALGRLDPSAMTLDTAAGS